MAGRLTDAVRGVVIAVLAVGATAGEAFAQEVVPQVPPGYEQPQVVQAQPGTAGAQVVVVPAYAQPGYPAGTVPQQQPPRMRTVEVEHSESIRALWLPGVIALPIAWVTTWTAASSSFIGDAATYSWIPIVGPWLMLTQDLDGYEAPFVISGVVQGAAAIMIVLGLSLRRTWTETEYVLDAPQVSFDVTPLPDGGYASATVRF